MPAAASLVAVLKVGRCIICDELPEPALMQLHGAIWNPDRVRNREYRKKAAAVLATYGKEVDPKTVKAHADHIELSWRRATLADPPTAPEKAVFPIDFDDYIGKAAKVGSAAMAQLEAVIDAGEATPADLVAAGRLGVGAVTNRQRLIDAAEARAAASKQPAKQMLAIFGVVSGHLDTNPGEIKNVTPIADLMGELRAEREQLRLKSGYDDDAAIEEALATG